MDVRVGNRVLCTIVIDYVPVQMRERLEKLKKAVAGGDFVDDDVWLNVDILPGPGLTFDPETKTLRGLMRADELPGGAPVKSVSEAKKTRSLLAGRLPKN